MQIIKIYHYKMELAINQAKKSSMKHRYGAILLHRNKVISSGYNYDTKLSDLNKNCPLRI
jgi:deoxycytidylate deaminase